MISFFLFESHKKVICLENLNPSEAAAIYKKLGATNADLRTRASRMEFFKKNVRLYHPDLNPGDKTKEETFKNLASAKDTLEKLPDNYFERPASFSDITDVNPKPPPTTQTENGDWQTDPSSDNIITKNDYTDANFFMKKMWELSGKSHKKYIIMAFDGRSFSNQITVFGSDKIYEDMAKSMIVYNSHGRNPHKTEAVFIAKENDPDKLYVIYVKPHFLNKHPIVLFDEEDFEGKSDAEINQLVAQRLKTLAFDLNESKID